MGRMTIGDLGYSPGRFPTGPKNSILDVEGVRVGQVTIGEDGDPVRNGVTVLLPRHPDDIYVPSYAGMYTLNGNGEVSGSYQIADWGYISTPIALTNSLSFGLTFQAIWQWTLKRAKEKKLTLNDISHNYGTPVVVETADWYLNDVYNSALTEKDVLQAFDNAMIQEEVLEGQNGGGAGMTCHMFPAGTGTSSRIVTAMPDGTGQKYTIGALTQTNYGHMNDMQIAGVPIGELLLKEGTMTMPTKDPVKPKENALGGKADDGSIVVILMTNAPMLPHQLRRLARHCAAGLAQVGGHGTGRNHSGDIFLAISTANKTNEIVSSPQVRGVPPIEVQQVDIIRNESMDALFRAASEVTEEAILNSMIAGRDGRTGFEGRYLPGFPAQRVKELLEKYRVII